MATVDPDDVGTWPAPLREALALEVVDVDPVTPVCDLRLRLSDEDVATLLEGRPLRAYHCTRLLPHEVQSIREDGLRALGPEHVEQRIHDAFVAGAIADADAERLRSEHIFATGDECEREGQVCACVGLIAFSDHEADGVWPLLSWWGGEAIYVHASKEGREHLRTLGTPSIVVLDLSLGGVTWEVWPGLAQILAGTLADLPEGGGDILYEASVPAPAVTAVWHPGVSEYDRFPALPRT